MIVVDASLIAELLIATPTATTIEQRLKREGDLHAPEFIEIEIASVLRQYIRRGVMTVRAAEDALGIYDLLGIDLHPARPLLPRVFELRDNLSAYDAAYVSLAELLDAPLWTTDRRLSRSPGHRASIEYVVSP